MQFKETSSPIFRVNGQRVAPADAGGSLDLFLVDAILSGDRNYRYREPAGACDQAGTTGIPEVQTGVSR